jgi:hypothetical protein
MMFPGDYGTMDNYALTPYSRRNSSLTSLHRTPSYGARIAEHIRPSYSTAGYGRQSYGTRTIKFKRKGAFRSGILLGEAQANARLSNNDRYTFFDLGADDRGNIAMQIRVIAVVFSNLSPLWVLTLRSVASGQAIHPLRTKFPLMDGTDG